MWLTGSHQMPLHITRKRLGRYASPFQRGSEKISRTRPYIKSCRIYRVAPSRSKAVTKLPRKRSKRCSALICHDFSRVLNNRSVLIHSLIWSSLFLFFSFFFFFFGIYSWCGTSILEMKVYRWILWNDAYLIEIIHTQLREVSLNQKMD